MAKTKLRDIEICVEEDTLKVIPYELTIDLDGYLHTNTSKDGKALSVAMNRKDNQPLIDFILECNHTLRGSWDGFSEWDTTERFYDYAHEQTIPERLRKWLEGMPSYSVSFPEVAR
jgi:hypothetical protein